VKSTEESTTTATDSQEASNASESNAEVKVEQTPVQRARAALAAEELDRTVLEGVISDLDAELARLEGELSAAESRAAMMEGTVASAKDQLLRLNADFDNFRRRSASEKEALSVSVKGDVVVQLLPLIDNFELARTQVKVETEGEQRINSSYQGLYKQMVDIMRGLGIEAVPTTGTVFNPEIHEAIMQEPNNEVPDGTILQEFRKGFKIGEKLLRPAMVKVSTNDGSGPAAEPAPTSESS